MKKREADFTILFRHWLKAHHVLFGPAAFELKQTCSKALSFDSVALHQLDGLEAVRTASTGFLYKAPDDSRSIKPFDLFYLKHSEAYVVIKYPDFFCVIDAGKFQYEKLISDRKSLTSDRARAISMITVPFKKPVIKKDPSKFWHPSASEAFGKS